MPWLKGKSGNPNGRPPLGGAVVERFRKNPKSAVVIERIIKVASTLGTDKQHPDAMACAKIVANRLLPKLQTQTISLETDGVRMGPVILPSIPETKQINYEPSEDLDRVD